jgi:transposase
MHCGCFYVRQLLMEGCWDSPPLQYCGGSRLLARRVVAVHANALALRRAVGMHSRIQDYWGELRCGHWREGSCRRERSLLDTENMTLRCPRSLE